MHAYTKQVSSFYRKITYVSCKAHFFYCGFWMERNFGYNLPCIWRNNSNTRIYMKITHTQEFMNCNWNDQKYFTGTEMTKKYFTGSEFLTGFCSLCVISVGNVCMSNLWLGTSPTILDKNSFFFHLILYHLFQLIVLANQKGAWNKIRFLFANWVLYCVSLA